MEENPDTSSEATHPHTIVHTPRENEHNNSTHLFIHFKYPSFSTTQPTTTTTIRKYREDFLIIQQNQHKINKQFSTQIRFLA